MSKNRITADEAVTVAVGVPAGQRELHAKRILKVLEQTGYGAVEMTPNDILQQAAHIHNVRAKADAMNTTTNTTKE